MEVAKVTQQASLASADRTRQELEEMKALGAATLERMHQNTQRIEQITGDVKDIESGLSRAQWLVGSTGRRLATNKLCLVLICVLVLCVAAAIVLAVVLPLKQKVLN
jgi:hypothetical protein